MDSSTITALHNRTAAMGRELAAADRIPYTAHVAPTVVRTALGDYLQVFRLGGTSFESNDDEELNNWHERLNVLWRNVGSPNVALWTQVIRRRAGISAGSDEAAAPRDSGSAFAAALDAKYRSRLANETLMVNEIYLAALYRPTSGIASGLASKVLEKARRAGPLLVAADALDACEKLAQKKLGSNASAARSQPYYLDVTHPQANKGAVVLTLSKLLNIPPEQMATIGDMPNDVLMFRNSGFSIAMGNASDEVKSQATAVTDSNQNEGFANAVRKFILRTK